MAKKNDSKKSNGKVNPNVEFDTVDIIGDDNDMENETEDTANVASSDVQSVSLDTLGLDLTSVDWHEVTRRSCSEPGIMMHKSKVMLNARLNSIMKQHGFTSVQIGFSHARKAIILKPFRREGNKTSNFLVSTTNFYKEHNINITNKVEVAAIVAGEGDNILFVADLPAEVFLHNQALAGLNADAQQDVTVATDAGDVN